MKDIALAGFMMTAEEWAELDAGARAQLVALAQPRRDDGWVVAPVSGIFDVPRVPQEDA